MTRREFTQLLLAIPLAPLMAEAERTQPPESPADETWLSVVQAVRGEPLNEETRRRLANALKAQNELLARLRQFKLPEGSEPAFVFQPVPAPRREAQR
ncbi:MAG: hypothetical protein NZL85_01650 [Fimbriimonadales bacterium]|nr:hypothetical protein [Fimbriimonadales bacterium]